MATLQHYPFHLGAIPLLLVSEGGPVEAATRGTVLFFHGLGANKELNGAELTRLAKEGFLAIGVDAVGHGERRYPDFDQRFASGPDRERRMIDLVAETVREVPGLVESLKEAGLAHDGGVGLCGVSMGGFIGYGVVPSKAIDALVAIIASPVWKVDVEEHPVRHTKKFFPCAVLSQVAGKDELIDAGLVHAFHQRLATEYQGAPAQQAFELYPHSAHHMRQQDWDAAIHKTVEWFRTFLKPQD